MRQKFIFILAIGVCLALAFGAVSAASRVRDDAADRARRTQVTQDGPVQDGGGSRLGEHTAMAANEARSEFAQGRSAKAEALLAEASKGGPGAVGMLYRAATMDLPSSPANDKMLAEVYTRLAGHYGHAPAKQVQMLGMALQYQADPGEQAELQRRIEALGGDAHSFAFMGGSGISSGATTRTFGVADLCTAATAIALDYNALHTIDPGGDHDWFTFTLAAATGGVQLRIETFTDTPGTGLDDTDLTLCDSVCTGAGGGDCDGATIAFNDDGGGNDFFTSLINTSCLPNGTYYLSVGGFADIAGADNFTLDIDGTDCTPPSPDDFEPDNSRADASLIGLPTSPEPGAPVDPDRVKAEIQCHNFFPAPDKDWVKFSLARNELVHIETACDFPTILNNFTIDCTDHTDTVIRLHYASPSGGGPGVFDIGTYGGLCNQANIGFGPICADDTDCPDPSDLDGPVPGFPPCISFFFFQPIGPFNELPDQYLAINDDGGQGLASLLELCLPTTTPRAASPASSVRNDPFVGEFHWYVEISPWNPSNDEDYCVQVKNIEPCCYEFEPNNDLGELATPMCLGGSMHGIFEFSETVPFQDADVYCFDVDATSLVTFETTGPDAFLSDTGLQLYVGPDNNGDFFFTGITDDDGGTSFLSRLDLILPPAADLLGVVPPEGCVDRLAECTADGDDDDDDAPCLADLLGDDDDDDTGPPLCPAYYLNVTSFFLNSNFPYELMSTVSEPPIPETEPNDDCATTAETAAPGDTFAAEINPTCDFDTYKVSLAADTALNVAINTSSDSVMEVIDCATNARVTCDDDGGPGLASLIGGCFAAGDYCFRVRAFSGFATFPYDINFGDGGGCDSGVDPGPVGDGIFKCDDVPAGEFDICP